MNKWIRTIINVAIIAFFIYLLSLTLKEYVVNYANRGVIFHSVYLIEDEMLPLLESHGAFKNVAKSFEYPACMDCDNRETATIQVNSTGRDFTIRYIQAREEIKGKYLTVRFGQYPEWSCKDTNIEETYLPANCRQMKGKNNGKNPH